MADTIERIVLEADDRPAVAATGRANKALDQYERSATRATDAAQTATDAQASRILSATRAGLTYIEKLADKAQLAAQRVADGFSSAVDKALRFAEAVAVVSDGVLLAGRSVEKHRSEVDKLLLGYRTARVALSPTIFTAVGVAAGVAAESVIRLAVSESKLYLEQARLAESMKTTVATVRDLQAAERIAATEAGRFTSAFAKLSQSQSAVEGLGVAFDRVDGNMRPIAPLLRDISDKIGAIEDPAERSRRSIAIFGTDIHNFDLAMRGAVEEVERFGGSATEEATRKVAKLGDDLRRIENPLEAIRKSFRVWTEELRQGTVQALGDLLIRLDRLKASLRDQSEPITPVEERSGLLDVLLRRPTKRQDEIVLSSLGARLGASRADDEKILAPLIARAERVASEQERSVEGLRQKLSEFQRNRDAALAKLAQGGEKSVSGAARGVAASDVLKFSGLARETEAQIKLIEEGKRRQEEAARRVAQAEKQASDELQRAKQQEYDGIARILTQHEQYRRELGLSMKANRDLAAAVEIRIQTEARQQLANNADTVLKQIEEEGTARRQAAGARLLDETKYSDESNTIALKALTARLGLEADKIEAARDAELRAVEAGVGRSLESKVSAEARKSKIEEDAALRIFALRADLLDRELQLELDLAEASARARGLSEELIAARRDALIEQYAAKAQELEIGSQAAIDRVREDSAIRQRKLIQDENQRIFDSLERAAENLLGNLLSTSKSASQKIRAFFEAALLTPFTKLASIGIAQFLAPVLGPLYGAAGGRGVGAGSSLGSLGGIFAGLSGAGGVFSAGAPGGTPGFAGPVGGASSGVFGGIAGLGGLAGLKASGLGLLSALGSIGTKAATPIPGLTGIGIGPNGQLVVQGASKGVQGAAGGALLAGGGILAFDGLRRGGLLGLAEATAGGALIGAKFGGPLGALIGGGIGAAAGFVRLFIRGATDKIVEKVQSFYGVKIDKGFAKDPLLGIIKQVYGGNIDLGIRSQQVRDLVELYAMSTGQGNAALSSGRPRALSFSDSGGALREQAGYYNGAPTFYAPRSSASQVVIGSVQLVVDGQSAASFLDGRIAPVIAQSPEAVSEATQTAQRLSLGRRAAEANQFGLVTA